MLSPCLSRGRLFCRLAVLRQRLLEFLLDAEGIGGGACPEFPQSTAIALAPAAGDDRPRGETRRMRVMPPFDAVTPGINGWRASTAASVARSGRSRRRSILARCWKFKVERRKFTDRPGPITYLSRAGSLCAACACQIIRKPGDERGQEQRADQATPRC
jgi:hypothetical protein